MGSFDEAVISRVHVSLYYPQLDMKTKMKIVKKLLKRLERQSDFRVGMDVIEFLEHRGLTGLSNGRQIRNMVSTAVALAREEVKEEETGFATLRPSHLAVIHESSNQFNLYMKSMEAGLETNTAHKF